MERAIDTLTENPRPSGKLVKAIQGTKDAFLRCRVDDYRILYEIFDSETVVLVLGILHRSDLEDWLKRQR
jgi:mRNA-degrading endonuclease RelE of RelBE toxin-antitoxin system